MTVLQQILQSQAQKELTANENFTSVAPAGIFAMNPATTAPLTWGYYGGYILVNGVLTLISNGTLTLTDNATNYIEVDNAGTVSSNTSGFTAGKTPLQVVVAASGAFSSIDDRRLTNNVRYGYLSKSVAGGTDVTLTQAEASNTIIDFTGLLTASINVIVPAIPNLWVFYNNTTGIFTLTVKTPSGTGIAITQTNRQFLYGDGTNINALS